MTTDSFPPDYHRSLQDVTSVAFDITAALIVVLDRQGRIMRFNPACEQLTGLRETDVQGRLLWPLVLDEAEAARAAALWGYLTPHQAIGTYENYWMDRQGQRRDLRWQTTFVLSPAGEIELVVATGIDVTEERQARLALEEREALFRTLFTHSADGVVLIDPHDPDVTWRIVNCNDRYARMNGFTPPELIGQSVDMLHEDDLMARRGAEFLEWIGAHPEGVQGGGTHVRRDGRIMHIESSSRLLRLGGKELILGIDRDVTALKEQEAELLLAHARFSYQAAHDDLTGLLNRAGWLQRLQEVQGQPGHHAVLFLDLDGFKAVNDTLGHAAGDEVLRETGRRMTELLRPTDALGRLGGDEFVALLTLRRPQDVQLVATRLEEALRSPIVFGEHTVTVGVSIGTSLASANDLPQDVLRRADEAMYTVKSARTGRQR